MVIHTVLDRNAEVSYSGILDLDMVSGGDVCACSTVLSLGAWQHLAAPC